MESRIFPSWDELETLNNPLTEGEKALLTFFDKYLPRDLNWKKDQKLNNYNGWLIFAQPYLNGSRPDVIIFKPNVSVIIFEVKDWELKHYEWKIVNNKYALFVNDSIRCSKILDPYYQVQYYKEKLIGQLIPKIGELVDNDKNNFGLIKTGLYFHKANTENLKKFFNVAHKENKSFPILGSDYLKEDKLNLFVPELNLSYNRYWEKAWNNDLLFWFKPPKHSIEQGKPLTLKGNQNKIALTNSGHFRVRGVAGSGKTQALAYRAANLAHMGLDVLIVTFNITLWHFIKDLIARVPVEFHWSKITFNHFHGFCKDILIQCDSEFPNMIGERENFFQNTIPETVIEKIQNKEIKKYDAILIDEGQDYYFEWYSMLSTYFLSERDELLILMDKKQNIYERQLDWLDKRITKIGLEKFKEKYIDLKVSIRLPYRIAQLTNKFSEEFNLNQELVPEKIESDFKLIYSNHIIWSNIKSNEWLSKVFDAYRRLKHEGIHPSDMIILLPNHSQGIECVKFFNSKNLDVNHVFEDEKNNESDNKQFNHKKSFWMGDSRLKMSTIHSFKGWELRNVVLLIPSSESSFESNIDSVVYTAMTRSKENIIILNCNERYNNFGNDLPSKWNEQGPSI